MLDEGKSQPRFLAAVQDIFFAAKITASAKRVGVEVEFIQDEAKLLEETQSSPCVLIMDLNNAGIRPIELIQKIKGNPMDPPVQIIGFLSHVQGELMREAQKAGCDLVLPRSAFSQNLDELLRQRSCHL